MYQEHFPWGVILFHEHFGNNVCNTLHYISILDHTSQWQAEPPGPSTEFSSADSAARVHTGPENLLETAMKVVTAGLCE